MSETGVNIIRKNHTIFLISLVYDHITIDASQVTPVKKGQHIWGGKRFLIGSDFSHDKMKESNI